MKALALTVWDKTIFKVFSFGCYGNQSSSWNSYLWSFLKVHHPRIISVKFHWNLLASFRGEDFSNNCSWTDGHTDGRTDNGQWSITIAHPEDVVLRWANKFSFSSALDNPISYTNRYFFSVGVRVSLDRLYCIQKVRFFYTPDENSKWKLHVSKHKISATFP